MPDALYLKNIENSLEEMGAIPLWGHAPSFPWEKFSAEIAKTLDQKSIKIALHRSEYLDENRLLEGMGQEPLLLPFTLSPLPTTFFWAMPKNTLKTLTDLMLTSDHRSKGFTDQDLQAGFTHYLFLNIIDTFNQLNPYGNLSVVLNDEASLPHEKCLCIDSAIQIGNKPFWVRIICPKEARSSFISYFQIQKPSLFESPSSRQMPLSVHFEIGRTELTVEKWKKAKVGDLILLDSCTYDIKADKGTAILTLGKTPLFDVRIKEGNIKLLEYAFIEEDKTMAKDFSEEDITENFEEMEEEEGKPLWAPKGEEMDKESLLSTSKIPLSLTVEIGRVQMTFEKIAQLKPGNVLDLGFGPNPNVFLLVNGKRIAKGELVKLGESLGVKILTIGS